MSFHASSRLILHADVSYIIDIACHWSFFPILPVLATFWIAKTLIFFHFPTPNFCRTDTRRTYVHPFDLDYWAKTPYRPIFRHCFGGVLQHLAIFYEKSALNPEIWAENREKFNKVGDVSDPETEEQMLVVCAWVCASVSWPHDVMNIKWALRPGTIARGNVMKRDLIFHDSVTLMTVLTTLIIGIIVDN